MESKMDYETSMVTQSADCFVPTSASVALSFDPHRCDHSPTCNRRTKHS